MTAAHITIEPRGPFSFAAAADFLAGFRPASGGVQATPDRLRFAFPIDGSFEAAGVSVREENDRVECDVFGTRDLETVRRQVARIFSLDHDGSAYLDVGRRDPVIGELQTRYGGLRPVCFYSPYEAAAWAIIAARMPMTMAARVKASLAHTHGQRIDIDGEPHYAFPSPDALLGLQTFSGLSDEKLKRLHAIAEAAKDGRLDAERLRAMAPDEAIERLQSLRGVGAWTSGHILVRGAGTVDVPTFGEPRVRAGVALAYKLDGDPDEATLKRITEGWKPFRTWVCVLVAVHLSRSGQWNAVNGPRGGLARPRSRAPARKR